MSTLKRIKSPQAPAPGGHYSQGTGWEDLVFISGQLPVAIDGSHRPEASFEEQARLALSNLLAVAEAAGSDAASVLKVTAFIVGIDNWPRFNTVFAETFATARPARAVVPVPELHYGYLVEVEAIAVRTLCA